MNEAPAILGGMPLFIAGVPQSAPGPSAAPPLIDRLGKLDGSGPYLPDDLVKHQLTTATPQDIDALSRDLRLNSKAHTVQQRTQTLEMIEHASETMAPAQRQALVRQFAMSIACGGIGGDQGDGDFGQVLEQSIKSGAGATFAASLIMELQSDGNSAASSAAAGYVDQAVTDLKTDFEAKDGSVQDVIARGRHLVGGFGLDASHQAMALKKFQDNNDYQGKVDDKNGAGALLMSTVAGLQMLRNAPPILDQGSCQDHPLNSLENTAGLVIHDNLPELATTPAGAKAVADAVESGEQGNLVLDAISELKRTPEQTDQMRKAVVSAIGARALENARDNKFRGDSKDMFKGLQKLGSLFGVNDATMAGLVDTMEGFGGGKGGLKGPKADLVAKDLDKDIEKISAGGSVSESLRALGVIAAGISLPDEITAARDGSKLDKMKAISDTLFAGQGGAELVLDSVNLFAKGELASGAGDAAEVISKFGGPLVSAVGAVTSGWSAADAYKHGDIQKGIGETITSAGELMMTVSPLFSETGPGAAIVAGVGALTAFAGTLVSFFSPKADPQAADKTDIKDALIAAQVKPDLAEKLSDVTKQGQTLGPWIQQVARGIGCTPTELLLSMNSWPNDKLTDFLDAERLQLDTDGNNANRRNDARVVIGGYADALEDPRMPGNGRNLNARAMLKYDDDHATQAHDRATTDDKTGDLVYDQAIVADAAAWVHGQGLLTTSIPVDQGGSGITPSACPTSGG